MSSRIGRFLRAYPTGRIKRVSLYRLQCGWQVGKNACMVRSRLRGHSIEGTGCGAPPVSVRPPALPPPPSVLECNATSIYTLTCRGSNSCWCWLSVAICVLCCDLQRMAGACKTSASMTGLPNFRNRCSSLNVSPGKGSTCDNRLLRWQRARRKSARRVFNKATQLY